MIEPKKEWVSLTEEQIYKIAWDCGLMSEHWIDLMKIIEAKLKEVNE